MKAPKSRFFTHFLTPLLILSIGGGSPLAYALRPMSDKSGLEEALHPKAGLEEPTPQERAATLLNNLRSIPAVRGPLPKERLDLRERAEDAFVQNLTLHTDLSTAQAIRIVRPLANKVARFASLQEWDQGLEHALATQVTAEVQRLRQPPALLTLPLLAKALPKRSPEKIEALFTSPDIPEEIRRSVAVQAMRMTDPDGFAHRMVEEWRAESSPTGLEELEITLATLADAARGRPGVLVIEAGVLGRLDWLEGLLSQPEFAQRVIIFGTGSIEARELASRSEAVRLVESDRMEDLFLELLSIPQADRIGYLGQRIRFEELQSRINRWGPELQFLELDVRLRFVLSALGVPESVLDQIDAAQLQGDLIRLRAA